MGTIWIGIDDTDSPRGGCTTWVLTELVRLARTHGLDLLGEPRLVRLNPNIPWRTRGNAALAARFGHGAGSKSISAELDGARIFSHARGREPTNAERTAFVEAAWDRVRELAESDPGTDPALVAVRGRLPPALYWAAVREVVPVDSVVRALDSCGADYRTRGSARGLVGASAAIAWPGRRRTWELISYRSADRWGTRRTVDSDSVIRVQRADPHLFLCHDPRTRRLLIAPHSPCPILFGLRGRTRAAPLHARARVRSEPVERWMLFRTNQGTGDHLVARSGTEIAPFLSAIVEGTVASIPHAGPGGHVRFDLEDPTGERIPCVAFEPTKTLPRVARSLAVGDRVRLWGSRGGGPGLRLEGLRLVRPVPRFAIDKPTCPTCDRPSRSRGRGRGF
ncbi:MAG: tRNA(Ile)(2)-agmatinylcytidine synthase, partial [Thermoplasmata archaeon]